MAHSAAELLQGFAGKIFLVLSASVVLILAFILRDHPGRMPSYEAYAISVASISSATTVVSLVVLWFQPETMKRQLISVCSTPVDIQRFVAWFLCVWWLFGTTIITFKVFPSSSNGYFAAWAGLFASILALREVADKPVSESSRARRVKHACRGLLISSLVLLLAICIQHRESQKKSMADESIFGLVSACFTLVTASLLLCGPYSMALILQQIIAVLLVCSSSASLLRDARC